MNNKINSFLLGGVIILLLTLIIITRLVYDQIQVNTDSIIQQTQMIEKQKKSIEELESEIKNVKTKLRTSSHLEKHITETRVKITGYTNKKNRLTSLLEKPIPGRTCAVSRDLSHWLGGKVWIEGVGVRRVNDLTHKRFRRRVDVFVKKNEDAYKTTSHSKKVVFLGKG